MYITLERNVVIDTYDIILIILITHYSK